MPTPEERVEALYGFPFPDEFFRFREFLAELPRGLLGDALDMRPAYPFLAAGGKKPREYRSRPLWEDRYYHDLPEFVTLFIGSTDGLHWGYVFDAPGERPPAVAHYWHSDTFEHAVDGDGLFEAVRWQAEQSEVEFHEMIDSDPDEEKYYRRLLAKVAKVRDKLAAYWGGDRGETGDDYLDEYGHEPEVKPVAMTWDRLGIVVPKKLYRPLAVDLCGRGRLDPTRAEVEPLVAAAGAELKAGRPGAALKLGRDLWVVARDFPESYALLDAAYAALGREPLRRLLAEARAFQAHCDAGR